MKVFSVAFALSVLFTGGLSQPKERPLSRVRLSSPSAVSPRLQAEDTIRVLALMVEFKSDSDSRTSGDGTFAAPGNPDQIDPPPHDASYFTGKLRFLENYFRKVSNGKVLISADLFGPVVTLAENMAVYSPPREGPNEPLARLVVDSWSAANDLNPAFPFSQYEGFIIFHAGVGRDIDLVGIFGFDPTPLDIPSVTLNLASMRDLLNDPAFPGIPVNGGSFFITNSMILPETETRVFTSGSRSDTLQLSINGLLAASFGSFLGLPDLFDTRTGRSGIGQFGLMDGAAIFAYSGLFPPEPSAWEKVYLGWTTPTIPAAGASSLILPAVGLTTAGNDTIYKIPITHREYFLVENRSRDPLGNGQMVTLIQNGVTVTRHYERDTTGFFFNDVRGITGSLIDVEDFDWAISGDMSLQSFEGGGILIWHVDEDIIEAGLASNSVNADPERRGVDLEEADGSQDIGVPYEFLEAGSGTENGWPPDAWFAGNPAPVYRNEFSETSIPSSNSNAGARSFISMKEFSAKSVRAVMTVDRGSGDFRPGPLTMSLGSPSQLGNPTVMNSAVFVPSAEGIFVFQKNGSSGVTDPAGLLSASPSQFPLAGLESARTVVAGVEDSTLRIWELWDNTGDGVYDSVGLRTVAVPNRITAPPMMVDSAGTTLVVVGDESGTVWKVGLDGTVQSFFPTGRGAVKRLARGTSADGSVTFTSGGSLFRNQNETQLGGGGPWLLAAGNSQTGAIFAVAEEGGHRVAAYDPTGDQRFEISVSDTVSEIIVADVDGDGRLDIVVVARSRLYAFNENGTTLDFFPKQFSGGNVFVGTPVVIDVDGNGYQDLVCLTRSGTVFGYDRNGSVLPSFPFQAASPGDGSLVLYESGSGSLGLIVAGPSGAVQAWESAVSWGALRKHWSGFLNDAGHSNFYDGSGLVLSPLSTEFLPKDRVYNWPNPVYGSLTRIRYYTTEPASISVKIFDVAGGSITELRGESAGGVDGELTWNVQDIQSGIYLARLEAQGSGKRESVVIKIAVVK
ncbi:MAG: VCBS repeat-containing protein [Ignavibacteriales bacterium]|nr:VCBS repeat-containing protein [Ignavibacteriales bacterium]